MVNIVVLQGLQAWATVFTTSVLAITNFVKFSCRCSRAARAIGDRAVGHRGLRVGTRRRVATIVLILVLTVVRKG